MAYPSLSDVFSPVNGFWIRTQDPDVLYWNPVIEGPDSKAELVWATRECEHVFSDVEAHPIPFGAM